MRTSQVLSALAVILSFAVLSSAQIPIWLGHGLVQSGLGIGAQIGGGLATLGAAALAAGKWKAEKTQPILYKQPVIQKSVPVQLTATVPLKHDELGGLGGLGDLGSLLGGGSLGGSLQLSLSKSLGRRRRSAEDYYVILH